MTRDEIIRMAEDCSISHRYYEIPVSKKGVVTVESSTHRLCQFAELIAQQEREACAKVCEDLIGTRAMARHCADAIRARGDASDISQEPVYETAKNRHISYVCPNCHWSLNRQELDTDIYDVWVEKNT